ncbi:MAG: glycosyltransferase [Treponema sp.]|nr:glycosyltransferase [Treponema sp.]
MNKITNYPKISIITPCFNSGRFLEETIQSVLDQKYPNLEYIIIDGGSTDNTLDIIKKYEEKLTYWISEKDEGMYDAIQKGFDKSTGEILAWINSDDLYHKKSLFIIAELFSKFEKIQWLVGASTFYDECGRGIIAKQSRKFTKYDFLLGDYKFIQQESCFFRKALYEKAGSYVDKNLKYAGDFELWFRFFQYEKLYVVDALIGGFRVRSSNQLSLEGFPKYLEEAENILKTRKIPKHDKIKIIRYKIFYNSINFFSKILIRILNKYRKIEFGKSVNFKFDRITQQFEIKQEPRKEK